MLSWTFDSVYKDARKLRKNYVTNSTNFAFLTLPRMLKQRKKAFLIFWTIVGKRRWSSNAVCRKEIQKLVNTVWLLSLKKWVQSSKIISTIQQSGTKCLYIAPITTLFNSNSNKTAGYYRHILRLPIFAKKAFEMKKTFFFCRTSTLTSS